MSEARLTKVHLGVDHARQDVQAGTVNNVGGRGAGQIAERHNPPLTYPNVAYADAVMVDDGAAFEDQIEAMRHKRSDIAHWP